jgi:hypothetical protein
MEEHINQIILDSYKDEVLKHILPNGQISNVSYMGGQVEIKLNPLNKFYEGSKYFTNSLNKPFVHFTSLQNCINICTTNKLRFYDLNYVDDPNEIVFAIKHLGLIDKYNRERIKARINSFSFCSYPFESDESEYGIWRMYGTDGFGVGIVFEFSNDCKLWENYHISQVYYNENEILGEIKEVLNKHVDFFRHIKLDKPDLAFDAMNLEFPDDLFKFFAFHKYQIFKIENEVRIIYYSDPREIRETKYYTINKSNKPSNYIEIPLSTDDAIAYRPAMKIDKIILGYRYSEADKKAISDSIKEMYARNSRKFCTSTPKVEITQLKEKYFN